MIALLGAPGARKSALAASLQAALAETGSTVVVVPDLLEVADSAGSPLGPGTFMQLADAQTRLIEDAMADADTVLTLSTALQIAAQSALRHGSGIADEAAAQAHALCTMTLLLAPSSGALVPGALEAVPCEAESLDTGLRAALDRAGLPYGVLTGSAQHQLVTALAGITRMHSPATAQPRWHGFCERCGDGACERHALRTA